ncbi:MAG: hypothetical protein JW737_09885 [Acidobacteria bacterium]|nr:hypothetical protein [Acidobacteriota bacterium]
MKKYINVLIILLLTSSLIFSDAKEGSDWRFSITPSIWTVGIDGDVSVLGESADISVPFSDILSLADIGGNVQFEAWFDNIGIIGSAGYLSLSYDTEILLADTTLGLDLTQLQLALAYRIINTGDISGNQPGFELAFTGGFYYMHALGSLEVEIPYILINLDYEDSADWVNAAFGARMTLSPTPRMKIILTSDISGFDSEANITINFEGRAAVALADSIDIFVGFRMMKILYEETDDIDILSVDITLQGISAGMSFRF